MHNFTIEVLYDENYHLLQCLLWIIHKVRQIFSGTIKILLPTIEVIDRSVGLHRAHLVIWQDIWQNLNCPRHYKRMQKLQLTLELIECNIVPYLNKFGLAIHSCNLILQLNNFIFTQMKILNAWWLKILIYGSEGLKKIV